MLGEGAKPEARVAEGAISEQGSLLTALPLCRTFSRVSRELQTLCTYLTPVTPVDKGSVGEGSLSMTFITGSLAP